MKKMKSILGMGLVLVVLLMSALAFQDIKVLDEKIKVSMIDPAVNKAKETEAVPDWVALDRAIAKKYDAKTADRNVTRAKLFFYYAKDWKKFASAIVNYTEKHEDKTDLKTMLVNATFVLQHSSDKAELAKALGWAKMLTEKEPGNEDAKRVLAELTQKVSAQ